MSSIQIKSTRLVRKYSQLLYIRGNWKTRPSSREMVVNEDCPQDDPDKGFSRKGFTTTITMLKTQRKL